MMHLTRMSYSFAVCLVSASSLLVSCQTTRVSAVKDVTNPESTTELAAASHPLQFLEWDVRFTNPSCQSYLYDPAQPVLAVNGETLTGKPKDTFCNGKFDRVPSAMREEAPQFKLLKWINETQPGDEIFFAYLSFSNWDVENAICEAVKQRGVKVTFVIDSTQDATVAEKLAACTPSDGDASKSPRMIKRGNTPSPGPGDTGIGYAHNKIFMINPGRNPMKLAFSSGNMTSGIVLHHENWNFITMNSDAYFPQAHVCLMKTQLDDEATKSRKKYAEAIATCRKQITTDLGFVEESDVKVYFTPGEGVAAREALVNAVKKADKISVAAHRFKYPFLTKALRCAASRTPNPATVEIVTDDDTYWVGTSGEQTGDNTADEYQKIMAVVAKGGKVRWMETNHAQHLLHHNKYVVMNKADGSWGAVFGGAGNFTGTAFGTNDSPQSSCASDGVNTYPDDGGYPPNFENFYYIEVPTVLQRYNEQFPHMWNDLATPPERMPAQNILPVGAAG